MSIQRPGNSPPLSSDNLPKRNREVKISVVPDRAQRDLTTHLGVGQIQRKAISASKGVSIKINSENNNINLWGRPVLPGMINRPTVQQPVSTGNSMIPGRTELNAKEIQRPITSGIQLANRTVGIPVVVQVNSYILLHTY